MRRLFLVWLVCCLLVGATLISAQSSGSRGGVSRSSAGEASTAPSDHAAERFITITGTAEVRVAASAIRVVLAINSSADSAAACQAAFVQKRDELIEALTPAGVARDAIVTDMIALLPVYAWRIEKQEGREVAVEHLTGYRLQNNVHVKVATEAQAQQAIAAALAHDVTDVIAVDHWSDTLDQHKATAQERALAEARRKATLLLGALFETKPMPINVHEQTRVVYPKDSYESFENAYAGAIQQNYGRDNIPTIATFRPKNTYYQGFFAAADVQDAAMPMEPEISVVSTVKLYYAAPGRPQRSKDVEKK